MFSSQAPSLSLKVPTTRLHGNGFLAPRLDGLVDCQVDSPASVARAPRQSEYESTRFSKSQFWWMVSSNCLPAERLLFFFLHRCVSTDHHHSRTFYFLYCNASSEHFTELYDYCTHFDSESSMILIGRRQTKIFLERKTQNKTIFCFRHHE